MNKSIEVIWKDAFAQTNTLIVPRLNNLYEQKSKNIVDKFMQMFELNHRMVAAGAVGTLIVLSYLGAPFLGLFLALVFVSLLLFGRREKANLKQLDKGVSSYQYLKSFDDWIKSVMAAYVKIYTFVYPLLFLAVVGRLSISDNGKVFIDHLIDKQPEIFLVFGMPVYLVVAILLIAGLLSKFAGPIYQLDINLVYRQEFRKLDEILADMEELRA